MPGARSLSEYHDGGAPTGMFMLRTPRWKYNAYPGYAPELYDLENDPSELFDLAPDPAVADACWKSATGVSGCWWTRSGRTGGPSTTRRR